MNGSNAPLDCHFRIGLYRSRFIELKTNSPWSLNFSDVTPVHKSGEHFGTIFAPCNSLETWTVCIKILQICKFWLISMYNLIKYEYEYEYEYMRSHVICRSAPCPMTLNGLE